MGGPPGPVKITCEEGYALGGVPEECDLLDVSGAAQILILHRSALRPVDPAHLGGSDHDKAECNSVPRKQGKVMMGDIAQ